MTKEGADNKKAEQKAKEAKAVEKPSKSAFSNKALAGLFQAKTKPVVPSAPKAEPSALAAQPTVSTPNAVPVAQIAPKTPAVKVALPPEEKKPVETPKKQEVPSSITPPTGSATPSLLKPLTRSSLLEKKAESLPPVKEDEPKENSPVAKEEKPTSALPLKRSAEFFQPFRVAAPLESNVAPTQQKATPALKVPLVKGQMLEKAKLAAQSASAAAVTKKVQPTTPVDKDLEEEEKKSKSLGKPKASFGAFKRFDAGKAAPRNALLSSSDEDDNARRRGRGFKHKSFNKPVLQEADRPKTLTLRAPLNLKELAAQLKIKPSILHTKLLMLNKEARITHLCDADEIVLLGTECDCVITIDTSKEDWIRITDKSVKEEIAATEEKDLKGRAPIVAFMGHVDHGKTSLIDAIRNSKLAAGEAGAITQHMGAFRCMTSKGEICLLDTPGHAAFTAMRARGADATDIVVLVVDGVEGVKEQTKESIKQAMQANAMIVVAINKCDKPDFNPEAIYNQMSQVGLIAEKWGGETITVNTSAVTKEGVENLLESVALQAEVMELKANPKVRARGKVLESRIEKGLGNVATLLVLNGTLKKGDAIVFTEHYGKVRTLHDEHKTDLKEAGPSTPVRVTGLSGSPNAGEEFIVVENEKTAKDIAEARSIEIAKKNAQNGRKKIDEMKKEELESTDIKTLKIIVKADVQGSLEAVTKLLETITSKKVKLQIIGQSIGQITTSDIQNASDSKAIILAFHTDVERSGAVLQKQLNVPILSHDLIYMAHEEIKKRMHALLDKIPESNKIGEAEVRATFIASKIGTIAGSAVTEGIINKDTDHSAILKRKGEELWKGKIASLKREKDEVKEVKKGFDCGILLENFNGIQVGDVIEVYQTTYKAQEL